MAWIKKPWLFFRSLHIILHCSPFKIQGYDSAQLCLFFFFISLFWIQYLFRYSLKSHVLCTYFANKVNLCSLDYRKRHACRLRGRTYRKLSGTWPTVYPPPSSVLAHLSNSPQLIRKELFYQLHLSEWRRIFYRKSFVDNIFFLRTSSVVPEINVPLSQPVTSGYDPQLKDLRNYFQVLTMSYLC